MRTKIIAFISALVISITCIVPFTVSASDLSLDTVVNSTTFLEPMAGGVDSAFVNDTSLGLVWDVLKHMLDNPTVTAGGDLESFTIPSYTFVTGKTRLMCTGMSPIMVECTFVYAPTIAQNELFVSRVKNPADSLYYPVNCPVFTIKRSTGTTRYVLIPYNGSNGAAFTSAFSIYSDRIVVGGIVGNGGKTKCYQWDGESNFIETSYSFSLAGQSIIFWTNNVNSIISDMNDWGYNSAASRYYDCYTRTPVSFKQRQRTLAEGPSDYDILLNKITVDRRGKGIANANGDIRQPTDYWSYSNGRYKLYTSWINTNDTATENSLELNWSQDYQKVYNYNSTTVGGTVINNDNKQTVLNGAFSPAFDLDVGSLADLLEGLQDLIPEFKFGLDSIFDDLKLDLFDKLADFYGEMPGIDMEWDPEADTNNYLDISPPQLPDNPGGGTGDITVNVEVDITRPQVPAVTTENWLDIEFPTTTETVTFPVYIEDTADIIYDSADSMFSGTGYIPILVLLGFCGVAISILFKGV